MMLSTCACVSFRRARSTSPESVSESRGTTQAGPAPTVPAALRTFGTFTIIATAPTATGIVRILPSSPVAALPLLIVVMSSVLSGSSEPAKRCGASRFFIAEMPAPLPPPV